ncbi:putative LINE-1 type transposase domain-containing protein 1-like [Triplophysa rosa]|uniref:LINE-1 type transposase domain-containing protein 1-like n=1 Tax=Triplophysa rosa TaxID=992332 RepID=A0A9W7T5B6_TRIRA|nr:putative LINE-1 type transposase domain-containing protein 1-like [Triplophysa rosa]
MSCKEGSTCQSEKGPKVQRNLQSRTTDADTQDGGTSECGYSGKLTQEVTECVGNILEDKLGKFASALDAIASRLEDNTKCICETECRVSDVEDNATGMENKLRETETLVRVLLEKVDDLENRLRRDNIRILGLKEVYEGSQPAVFFVAWLPKMLELDTVKGHIKIDRAHRGLGPQRGDRPRPVIIKLHNFADKQRIMSAIKIKHHLEVEGRKVFIHQDLSSMVKDKRRGFNKTCEDLIKHGIRFTMRFLALLCFTHEGRKHSFQNPQEAQAFLTGAAARQSICSVDMIEAGELSHLRFV